MPDRTRLVVIALFMATLLFQLPYFDRWYALLDEGHILMFADIVARGGEIYRDATIYPLPGAFYLLAFAFELFGASIVLSRWIVVLEFCVFVPLVYLWMRRLVTPRWALGSVVVLWVYRIWSFPHWQMYSYSTTALLFLLVSMTCLLLYFDSGTRRWLWAAGLVFGMGVACKQDYGAALFVAGLATLFVATRTREDADTESLVRVCASFLIPGLLVGGVLGAYFLAKGILPDLVQMTVFNHMRGLATFTYPEIPDLLPLFTQDPGLRDIEGFFNYFPGLIFTVDAEGVRNSFLYRETPVPDLILKVFFYAP
ncbi:MAG: glycosyltransferase family 39 protein, partial [bacterium]|nr:glycosyltransferase family 39 protein [bacterium]